MHTLQPFSKGRVFLLGFIIIGLLSSYPLALYLPVWFSWENGPIENTQAGILLAGLVLALCFAVRAKDKTQRWFWIMVMPFWLIMFARELGWGAVFLPPLYVDPVSGPIYSSSLQLGYKPVVYPVAGALLLASAAVFLLTRQYQSLVKIWRCGVFPWLELLLVVVGAVLSTIAEGHGGVTLDLGDGILQLLEELSELWAYAALFAAQLRVSQGSWHD